MDLSCDDNDFRRQSNHFSITSIGLLNPLEEINVSKDSFRLKKRSSSKNIQKTPVQNEDLVTSIEYRINENEDVEKSDTSVNFALNLKESADLHFLNKVQFDREKYFRIHFQIEKPERELIEETLLHFEKKSDNEKETISQRKTSKVRKTLQINKRVVFPRNLSQETQVNARLSLSKSFLSKRNNSYLVNKGLELTHKSSQPFNNQMNESLKDNTSVSFSKHLPFFDPKPIFNDKSSLRSINGLVKLKKRKESSLILAQDFECKKESEKSNLFNKNSIKKTELVQSVLQKQDLLDKNEDKSFEKCKCIEIIQKLKILDISLTENILEQVMAKLNTINYSFDKIQEKYLTLEAENVKLKQQVHKLEKKKPESDFKAFLTKRSIGLSFLNDLEKNQAVKKSNPNIIPQSVKNNLKQTKLANFSNANIGTLNIPGHFLKNKPLNETESINTQRDSTTRKTTSFLSKRKSFFEKKKVNEKEVKLVCNNQNNVDLKPMIRNLQLRPSQEKLLTHFRG